MQILRHSLLALCLAWLTSITVAHAESKDGYIARPDGAKIYYKKSGQGDPIFLIHGYPLSGELFKENRVALEKHYTVVTIDQRGYGQSEAPTNNADIETYAEDALAVMDALKMEKAVIGGMSMGGPVVFEMYREAPERFTGMILMDTTAIPANLAEQGLWMGVAAFAEKEGVDALVPLLMKDMLTGPTRLKNQEPVEALTTIVKNASKQAAIAGATALANRPDSRSTLEKIDVPALVIVGIEDTIYPISLAKDMAKAIPNSTLALIDRAAHASMIENPEQVNKAILAWAKEIKK